ncbi:cell death-inducing p53-target protein 1 homolog [Strongylocentrotus purpuratus]|uniref:LITAF domain-containing protein n=1 Tax=Strongylocentrotus purpuratus TaxID=7668 RepID=A0A7M7NS45_STRPU|nr:cell death-inducing p53-target protein 1 homolog [Strongylocentrotus purpuratus]XP_030840714.1 cell death-inducing p53-target protein 1 homolog [Strongylocentrotus purpuratus]XP_030840715.1 cell death-inducing p53-target protein 1 homolog [Strongylocentrotus purpuratus]
MSDYQGAPPQYQEKSQGSAGGMEDTPPPPYAQGPDQPSYPATNPGYPMQPPPASGYTVQPPPTAGYPVQPPPAAGYPMQPPPGAGYPMQPPPAAGYPVQPPPPAGYTVQPPPMNTAYTSQPQAVDPNNVVIVSQPGLVVHHNLTFRDAPVVCACPNCHNQVTSNVRREIGGLTLLIMGALCIFGLWFFCCLIPLCIDACKDAVHTCPVCKHQLGRWSQL